MIRIHDKHFVPFLSASQIDSAVAKMAQEIADDVDEEVPIFIGVLNGSFMFVSDLMKHYSKPCELSFVKLSSYQGTSSTEKVNELIGLGIDVKNRTVVVLEDIVDTGNTLVVLKKLFEDKQVKAFKIATLFFKPEAYTKDIPIDYVGMEIPNKFIVGYGLDYDEHGRNLPEVYQLTTDNKNNSINSKTMINIVLFGKPGAGKGTQAEFLKDKYNLVHISTGDVFRYNLKNNTELGKQAKAFMDRGDLVPDELTIKMLQDEVEKNSEATGFLFDGFPRTIAQAEALDKFLESKQWKVTATVALEANDEILIQRLLERGKTSGRADDQDEAKIRNRYDEYNEKTAPLIDYYTNKNLFYSVNGIGTIEEVTRRLSTIIDDFIDK